ncbi:enoyl-CoA hydratase-related protein [Brevundimonas terrae]|uniref:Enoyl-CoA hydratase-related protein n=1 Tax=Brevundimonas terrae TaxID=363631 RepID=A0ABP3HSS4_9CAUL|nr:enoyl-CoA hydratase-related protein [Brevundimonas terrae]NIJ27783.1 enoyl-CoA hydratase [Brevundimonas terrae]
MAFLRVRTDAGVAQVTLARPEKLNALNAEMMVGLADLWGQLAHDPAVRVVLLTGEGERAFSSGADLGSLAPLATGAALPQTPAEHRWVNEHQAIVDAALLRGTGFTKPIVAAVNGLAVAAGFELMLGSDIRIASDQAFFQLTEVKRGLIPSGGSLARLPRQIGWANAMEMILAAERIDAARALSMGLVNRVVSAADVLPMAQEMALRIAEGAPLALTKAKEAVLGGSGRDLEAAFAIEQACQDVVMASADAREGPLAFMERRTPRFTGK